MSNKVQDYDSVKKWGQRLGSDTFKNALIFFGNWFEWVRESKPKFVGFTPDDFVIYQQNADNGTKFDILDSIQEYVTGLEGRASYKKTTLSRLRSFFLHNRAELPRDSSFIIRSDREKVTGKLEVEDIRKIVLSSNLMYQAIFTAMFQGGMGIGELEYWSIHGYRDLVEQLKDDPQVVKIDLPGRKKTRNIRPFYTFIGPDAIDAIIAYLDKRDKDLARFRAEKENYEDPGAIFLNQFGGPITRKSPQQYWTRHLRKLGYIPDWNRGVGKRGDTSKRYGLNIHELRDCFRSQWEKTPAKASVAEYLMGHQVDPLEYNKAFRDKAWVRKEYLKALSLLQIMSSGRPFGQVDEDVVTIQQKLIEDLQSEVETLRSGRNSEVDALRSEVEELRNSLKFIYEKLKVEA